MKCTVSINYFNWDFKISLLLQQQQQQLQQ